MEKQICKECGKLTYINNSKRICPDCIFKKNHKGMSQAEVYQQRSRERLKLKGKKIRVTGELDMFKEIWEERPHYCIECGIFLGNELNVSYFSHRKSKGSSPELRLNKDNIDLLCKEHHHQWDFGDRTKMNIYGR